MIYEKTISTPASTLETSKQRTIIPLEWGTIQELQLYFPPGSGGLLHLQFLREASQVFPKSTGDFSGDAIFVPFSRVGLPLFISPYELYALTWNEDDTYAHKVFIHINLEKVGVWFP